MSSNTFSDVDHPPDSGKSRTVSGRGRHVVFCTNTIAPYRLGPLKMLTTAIPSLTILLSTQMERDHQWSHYWSGLRVILQRSLSFGTSTRHPSGFNQSQIVHIPYDTIFLLRRLRPDVVISVEMGLRSVLSALYCAAVRSCRLVIWADVSEVTERGRGPVRILLRRWLIRRASAVIVNGASGRRYIEALGGLSEHIHEIPYTTDVDLFVRQAAVCQPAPPRRLLYVGRLITLKGLLPFLSVCIRWCELHPSRTIECMLVGDGELWGAIESLQTPNNLTIRLTHSIEYADLPEVYQRADVFVLPTLADTWALVVNEAMAVGLPILGSVHSQAVEEMVVDGINGWKFRGDDPEDSYRALCLVMDCPGDQLASMGKRARETAAAIGPEVFVSRVVEAIDRVCLTRGAILTNMLVPGRFQMFNVIGRAFELTVLTSKHESNRMRWQPVPKSLRNFSVRESFCYLLTTRKRCNGRTLDFKYLQVPLGLFQDLLRLRPRWVISTEMGARTLIALLYSSVAGIPLWVWWGGTIFTERRIGFLRRVVRKFLVTHVKHWISYGTSSTEYLNSIGVSSSRILTIQNCAAPLPHKTCSARSRVESDRFRFLYVGQLIARKGVDVLIRCVASLRAEGLCCSLTLVGSGQERSSLQRLASDLGLPDVHFVGGVLPDDTWRFYANADCLVLPTMEDVWGLVVNEAILAGVPVLCSIYAGCADELVPLEYRFDPASPEDLKRALRRAFQGKVKPIPVSVLRTPQSVAEDVIADIESELVKRHCGLQRSCVPGMTT